MNKGTPIRINHPNGSWGEIESSRHFDDGFYVYFNFGKDVKGESIRMRASVGRRDIVLLDAEFYARYIACRAWSEEQKQISAEYNEKIYKDQRYW